MPLSEAGTRVKLLDPALREETAGAIRIVDGSPESNLEAELTTSSRTSLLIVAPLPTRPVLKTYELLVERAQCTLAGDRAQPHPVPRSSEGDLK
jgi:hypothetical protein